MHAVNILELSLYGRVSKYFVQSLSRKFSSANENKDKKGHFRSFLPTFSLIFVAQFAKFVLYFSEIHELRSKFSQILFETFSKFLRNSLKLSTFHSKSFYFAINKIFLMWNGKIFIFIEHKLNENFTKMKNFHNNQLDIFVEGRKSLNLKIPKKT